MRLPLFLSVPHGSLTIPAEIAEICILTPQEIREDSDEQATAIYAPLQHRVMGFVEAEIARAAVDLNRAADDIGGDGVIKSHTCHGVPVYRQFPDTRLIDRLLAKYYLPYHETLRKAATLTAARLAIDCHTMAAIGPEVGPDPGQKRPFICLSNATTACPMEWLTLLAAQLRRVFHHKEVTINTPFQGGYITRHHGAEMPWLQLEFSRTRELAPERKSQGLYEALERWMSELDRRQL